MFQLLYNIPYFCKMTDKDYMQRCFMLALQGMGAVSPNPLVGCVVVYRDQIIGEGYHQLFGQPHAEVNAIDQVIERYGEQAISLLKEATVYVNLEPCAHFGKTPPCADLLIQYDVKRVVISNTDPFVQVAGKGIGRLKAAGIQVETGLLEQEGAFLNRRFFTRIQKQRPYIILKWAQTSDGYFAPVLARQQWISGAEAKTLTHQWRLEEDAILVGKQTAMIDNPHLTNRSGRGKNPIRLLIDRQLEVPLSYHIFDDEAKTIIFNELKSGTQENIQYVQMEDMQWYLPQKIAFQLYLMDIQSVIIEGGKNILTQFIDAGLWDEARIFTAPIKWTEGLLAPSIRGKNHQESLIGQDQLSVFMNSNL